MVFPRTDDTVVYVSPEKEVNAGLWTLFSGASVFLLLRIWCKYTRQTGLWYDDYILITSWLILMVNNIIITCEFATGYVTQGSWNDRMHILINITSCGTLLGQTLTKTAFGITLLRISNRWQKSLLWFCIATMNVWMLIKVLFQWTKYCNKSSYQQWYRIPGMCINYNFEESFKEGGNTYNIIMDFVFALIPWWITWPLEMRKAEKIGLCVTMSLGMIIAIFSSIRTSWEYTDIQHTHDAYYYWRNGMSMVWYSAEIAGTIIVQCIPILRPFLRDMHTTLTSKRLNDTEAGRTGTATWRSTIDAKRNSTYSNTNRDRYEEGKKTTEVIILRDIPEERAESGKASMDYSSDGLTLITTSGPLFGDMWPYQGSNGHMTTEIHSQSGRSWMDVEQHEPWGLSPPPRKLSVKRSAR